MLTTTRRALLTGMAALGLPSFARGAIVAGSGPLSFERVTVPGERAFEEWKRLKAAGRAWPVVIGGDEALERLSEQFSIESSLPPSGGMAEARPATVREILASASNLSFPADLYRWSGGDTEEAPNETVGEMSAGLTPPSLGLSVAMDLESGKALDKVHILLVPTTRSSEVPAHLRWGGWNACPPAEYHVAALGAWQKRYGAQLVGIDGDSLNLLAARRPATRQEALALAREQYAYCPDLVDQGVGSLSALAAKLLADDWWFFWWD